MKTIKDTPRGEDKPTHKVVFNQIQKEEDKVKEKDAKFFDKHVCSHCESNKIYICEPCMNDMAKQYDNYSN